MVSEKMSAAASEAPNEYQLDNTPADCIQSVKFGESNSRKLMRAKYAHQAPVLDCAFQV